MTYQKPAEGIMALSSYGNAKSFRIACDCTDYDHQADAWIEVEGDQEVKNVQISFFVNTWTPFWDKNFRRFKAAWDVLVHGVHRQEHHIILRRSAADNLVAAINNSIKELEKK
jgi:hypothetical protein